MAKQSAEYEALVAMIAALEPREGYRVGRILAALDTEQLDLVIGAHREEIERRAAELFLRDVLDQIEQRAIEEETARRDAKCGFLSAAEG